MNYYKIGDIVFVNQGRRGDFYRPINAIGIITDALTDQHIWPKGYRVSIAGNKEETYFTEHKYIQEKLS